MLTESGGDLIHQAAAATDEMVLGPLCNPRENKAIRRGSARKGRQPQSQGNPQRCGRRKAGALWNVSGYHQVRTCDRQVKSWQASSNSPHMVLPMSGRKRRNCGINPECVGLATKINRPGQDLAVFPCSQGDDCAAFKGAGHGETVIVIGMLANQVDPAWCERHDCRFPAIGMAKRLNRAFSK